LVPRFLSDLGDLEDQHFPYFRQYPQALVVRSVREDPVLQEIQECLTIQGYLEDQGIQRSQLIQLVLVFHLVPEIPERLVDLLDQKVRCLPLIQEFQENHWALHFLENQANQHQQDRAHLLAPEVPGVLALPVNRQFR